jgi:hypothetical protein
MMDKHSILELAGLDEGKYNSDINNGVYNEIKYLLNQSS